MPESLPRNEAQYSHIFRKVSTAHWPARGSRIPNGIRHSQAHPSDQRPGARRGSCTGTVRAVAAAALFVNIACASCGTMVIVEKYVP